MLFRLNNNFFYYVLVLKSKSNKKVKCFFKVWCLPFLFTNYYLNKTFKNYLEQTQANFVVHLFYCNTLAFISEMMYNLN